ncbi:uncharacterized protein LOC132564789 [Ylistrum balloti]|uniref:uncharacterized protein LOC132564789 n=1 Tax=Ylistrum balloti TaxID=509963 RepID=UPI002905B5B2|nr:uncharacterized protein LOC132564789 [Ylistrum balloti]
MGNEETRKSERNQNKNQTRKLYAYGSTQPLTIMGSFTADVKLCTGSTSKQTEAEFFVLKEKGKSLLSMTLALELGVLRLGPEENSVAISQVENLKGKYSKLFTGLGKLKDFELEIPIDNIVKPVVQSSRRNMLYIISG